MTTEKNQKKEPLEEETTAKKNRVVVSVTEMDCTVCAMAIEKRLKKVAGIKNVQSAVMLNKVFIDYDPKSVDPQTIRKEIDKTAYKSYMIVEET